MQVAPNQTPGGGRAHNPKSPQSTAAFARMGRLFLEVRRAASSQRQNGELPLSAPLGCLAAAASSRFLAALLVLGDALATRMKRHRLQEGAPGRLGVVRRRRHRRFGCCLLPSLFLCPSLFFFSKKEEEKPFLVCLKSFSFILLPPCSMWQTTMLPQSTHAANAAPTQPASRACW